VMSVGVYEYWEVKMSRWVGCELAGERVEGLRSVGDRGSIPRGDITRVKC
jgi:hypothetical protein